MRRVASTESSNYLRRPFLNERVLKLLKAGAYVEYRPFVQARQGTRFHQCFSSVHLVHGEKREMMRLPTFEVLRRKGKIVCHEQRPLHSIWGSPIEKPRLDWSKAWKHFK